MKSQVSPEPPEESMSQEKSTNSVEIRHFGGKNYLFLIIWSELF